MHKDICAFYCLFSFLFIAKDEINPFINILADNELFKSSSQFRNINIRIISSPSRKLNIMHSFAILHYPKIKFVNV